MDLPVNKLELGNPANALAVGAAAAYHREQTNALRNQEDRRVEAQQYVDPAMKGDNAAMAKLAGLDPHQAVAITTALSRMDANQRAKTKEQAEWGAMSANAILQATPAERAEIYRQNYAEGVRRGYDMSTMPSEYSPQLDPKLRANRAMAVGFLKLDAHQNEGMPVPLGDGAPAGGGAGGGVSSNNIGNVRPNGQSVGFQQPATIEDGVRLAVNNAKAYPGTFNGGQPMTLLQIGSRWAPAGDGANDPAQWARNVASIGGLPVDRPLDLNNPQVAAAFARGVHGAEHGANAVRPAEFYQAALTGGQPQGVQTAGPPMAGTQPVTQGDAIPAGQPQQIPQPNKDSLREFVQKSRPGWTIQVSPRTRTPVYDHQGRLLVKGPNGQEEDFIVVPKPEDTKPPAGYRSSATGDLEHIPGGPADPSRPSPDKIPPGFMPGPGGLVPMPGGPHDPATIKAEGDARRSANEKAIPQTVAKDIQGNVDALKQIDRTLAALEKNKTGVGNVADYIQRISPQWGGDLNNKTINPEGAELRALIADIGSLKIHDRSGAAVTASETPRLIPFIPQITDDAETIKKKLGNFRRVYEQTTRDITDYYASDNGFKPYKPATDYLNGGAPKAEPDKPAAPAAAPKTGGRPPLESFGR